MARIISISQDEALLQTRRLLLELSGHTVLSALGTQNGLDACQRSADLVVIGHSITSRDQRNLASSFRKANPKGLVVVLTRSDVNERLRDVDAHVDPAQPEELIRAIDRVLNPASERRRTASGPAK